MTIFVSLSNPIIFVSKYFIKAVNIFSNIKAKCYYAMNGEKTYKNQVNKKHINKTLNN